MKIRSFMVCSLVIILSAWLMTACSAVKTEAPTAATETMATDAASAPETAVAPAETPTAAVTATDATTLKIDASQIPQEKLDTTIYIACSVRGLENPYYIAVSDGVDILCAYLDSIGQKYEKQILDAGSSNDVQIDGIKQFVAKAGGNALVYVDPNETAIVPTLVEIVSEAGGYITTVWNKPEDVAPWDYNPNWVLHHSADDFTNGQTTAKALFDYMGGKGKVYVLEGMLGNSASINRVAGFNAVLADYPDIEVVHQDTGNWAANEALTLVETWLNDTPDVGGVWCANDGMATGALQALDAKGLKGKVGVTGIDANGDIVEGVKEGNVVATVSSDGYLQSGYSLAICYAVWAGLIDPTVLPEDYRVVMTKTVLVTSDNVDAYIADYVDSIPKYDLSDIWFCKAN